VSREKVIVGLSGGVDSAVAALCLLEQGFDVEGLFMFNWHEDERGYCTAAQDFQDARRVCDELAIPLHRADFSREYRERVFRYFLDEYAAGRTPNPDVLCNREIKFKSFLQYARRLGARRIATGHYAALTQAPDGMHLARARDRAKDQTYFLAAVPAPAFEHVIFPLAQRCKTEVREIAAKAGLHNHDKRDSTGICFIGERPFAQFLNDYLPARPGLIRDVDGIVLGEHRGLMFYTLGQRRGLGLGGRANAQDAPWYVVHKDIACNELWVAQDPQHPLLMARSLWTQPMHWIGSAPALPLRASAKIRHRQPDQACTVERARRGYRVTFDIAQRAATPGQFVVLYDGQRCLGGGAIERVESLAANASREPARA